MLSRPFVRMYSTGRLLCHWDPTWSWAQLQLVAACHGPGNTIIILTAARVLFLVAHNGDKQQQSHGSSAGAEPLASSADSKFTQQQLQFQQQQVLEKFSVKVRHAVLQQGWTAAVTPAAATRLKAPSEKHSGLRQQQWVAAWCASVQPQSAGCLCTSPLLSLTQPLCWHPFWYLSQCGCKQGLLLRYACIGVHSVAQPQPCLWVPVYCCRLPLLLQRYHAAVSAIGYDDKSGLLVIAGDTGSISSSGNSPSSSSTSASSSSGSNVSSPAAAPSAAFAAEGVTVSVWQLQERQLSLRFALGSPQVGACFAAC